MSKTFRRTRSYFDDDLFVNRTERKKKKKKVFHINPVNRDKYAEIDENPIKSFDGNDRR
jgi:hypothetical protein